MTAQQLKAVRAKANISQAALASILKVHPHTVYQWEAGKRRIPAMVEAVLQIMPKRLTIPHQKRKRIIRREDTHVQP